jgi:hypothetical protein
MKRMSPVQENWNPLLQALEGHSRSVSAVAFSRENKVQALQSSTEERGSVKSVVGEVFLSTRQSVLKLHSSTKWCKKSLRHCLFPDRSQFPMIFNEVECQTGLRFNGTRILG